MFQKKLIFFQTLLFFSENGIIDTLKLDRHTIEKLIPGRVFIISKWKLAQKGNLSEIPVASSANMIEYQTRQTDCMQDERNAGEKFGIYLPLGTI